MVAHALSVCRTGIMILFLVCFFFYFVFASRYIESQIHFYKHMKVSTPALIGLTASLRWAQNIDPAVCKHQLQEGELSDP